MDCSDPDVFVDLMQGRLDAAARARVEAHLEGCEPCRALLGTLAEQFRWSTSSTPSGWTQGSDRAGDADARAPIKSGQTIGRYVVSGWLGAGAMGVVYLAHDPELDRKVAIKLWRTSADAREVGERLTREARLLAQVTHPNVVTVYDVGSERGEVFVAMEHVEGRTLREWARETPRSPREILRVYAAAARGLVAAHAVSVVHRDFKPDNVLIDRAGRVRVTDFGLAASSEANGEVAGTPAYMAPEQRQGVATAKSDQYSFCVALHEALTGKRPVVGDGREPSSDLPKSIRTVLGRGLEPDPEKRFSDMEALLRELERDPAARARTIAQWALPIAIAAGVAVFASRAKPSAAVACDGGESKLAGVWDASVKDAGRRAFASLGLPYGERTFSGVERALDAYARNWSAARKDACEATHVRREQSAELFDLRMACYGDRLAELRSLGETLSRAEASTVDKAPHLASTLKRLDVCADARALRSRAPMPEDPATRAKVEEAKQHTFQARVLRESGRYQAAYDLAKQAAEQAKALGHAPTEADARLALARLELDLNKPDRAGDALLDAVALAERAHEDRLAAQALIEQVFVTGYVLRKYEEGAKLARIAEATIGRIGEDDELRSQLEDRLASLGWRQSHYAEARVHAERNVALKTKIYAPGDVRIAEAYDYLSVIDARLGRFDDALANSERGLTIWRGAVGDEHPTLGVALLGRSLVLRSVKRWDEALGAAQQGLAIFSSTKPTLPRHVGGAHRNVALALSGLGRHVEAIEHIDRALEVDLAAFGAQHTATATDYGHRGAIERKLGRYAAALADLEKALAVFEPKSGPAHLDRRFTLTDIGEAELGLGRPARAIEALTKAEALSCGQNAIELECAAVQAPLARALASTKRDPARARRLAEGALAVYERNPAYAEEASAVREALKTMAP